VSERGREGGEGRFAEQAGELDSREGATSSLDLWVSSLYSILSTANYY